MATLLKVLNNLADIKSAGGVALRVRTQELLSSWIARHGAFHDVPPRTMLCHAVPNARSLRAADDHLTE
jgi:hypothetical protein